VRERAIAAGGASDSSLLCHSPPSLSRSGLPPEEWRGADVLEDEPLDQDEEREMRLENAAIRAELEQQDTPPNAPPTHLSHTPLPHTSPTHLSHTPLPHTSPTHLRHTSETRGIAHA